MAEAWNKFLPVKFWKPLGHRSGFRLKVISGLSVA